MDAVAIKVQTRDALGKSSSRASRSSGRVPGVVYGEGGDSQHIEADPRDIIRILRSEYGSNTLLKLEVSGGEEQIVVLRDYQVHPFKRKLLHVDFLRVSEDTELTVSVPVRLRGKSVGEQRGSKLVLVARSLKVRCRAGAVPREIEVDVTDFEEGYTFYAEQLEFPDGVSPAYRTNFPVASVTRLRSEIEEEEGEEGEPEEGAEAEGEDGGKAQPER